MFYIMRQFILLIKNIEKHTALLNKNKKKGGGVSFNLYSVYSVTGRSIRRHALVHYALVWVAVCCVFVKHSR